jgi:proton-translocating NADH-quinone oxidoreductase chain N
MRGEFSLVLPAAILIGGAFILYLVSRLLDLSNRVESLLAAAILALSLAALIQLAAQSEIPLALFGTFGAGGVLFEMDMTGVLVSSTALGMAILTSLYSGEYLDRDPRHHLYYPLLLLLLCGLLGMFFTRELFNLFLLSELTTIAASALIAFRFHQESSIMAGFKYLIMSSMGTMIMLLGIYFVYRGAGTLDLASLAEKTGNLTRIGGGCFLLGFSLKAGVVPLHTWVPEVYTHAPSAISAFLAGVLSKSMLFMIPAICLTLGFTHRELGLYLIAFSALNMLLGTLRALNQRHLRRFLSFSAIAQTGYIMFALGVGMLHQSQSAYAAALFQFLAIAVTKSLAFLAVGIYEYHLETGDSGALQGIHQQLPWAAYGFSLALAGLAGIPLLAGFTGKWLVFSAALSAGGWAAWVGLAIFLLSTLIGLAGYLPMLIRQFYPAESLRDLTAKPSWRMRLPVLFLGLLVVLLGLWPTPWLAIIDRIMLWIRLL